MHPARLVQQGKKIRRNAVRAAAGIVAWAAISSTATICTAQSVDEPEELSPLDRAQISLFHVEVTGRRPDGTQVTVPGKAFAVGPDLLVTSLHVVGLPSDWALSDNIQTFIARAVPMPSRTVMLSAPPLLPAEKLQQVSLDDVLVSLPMSQTIDSVMISVAGLELDTYFDLSLCQIISGKSYRAILSADDEPHQAGSLNQLFEQALIAEGYEPAEYGSLFVFAPTASNFTIADGHDGSPIVDEDGAVVAVVSAVITANNGNTRILATPIQPLFPGAALLLSRAPEDMFSRLKCSLADSVKTLHDEIAAHADWTVQADWNEDGTIGDFLELTYESVSRTPNISSIDVGYEFEGIMNPARETEAKRIASDAAAGEITLEPIGKERRSFDASEIIEVGKKIVEKSLPEGGYIERVILFIYPTVKEQQQSETPASRTLRWRSP